MKASLAINLLRLAPLVLRRAHGLKAGEDIPLIESEARLVADPDWLAAYRAIIGAADQGVLPPCAPQVLAYALHHRILADPRFPLPLLGMVHLENTIEEHAPIPASSTLDLRARLQGHDRTERGITIVIATEARVGDELVWSSRIAALVRDRRPPVKAAARSAPPPEPMSALAGSSSVDLPANLGRRYARLAGDANPIHLSALSARPFGFPRAIIHGMWTLARALVEVDALIPPRPRRIDARFVRPVYLPGTVVVSAGAPAADGRVRVRVAPPEPGPPHMVAEVSPLPDRSSRRDDLAQEDLAPRGP